MPDPAASTYDPRRALWLDRVLAAKSRFAKAVALNECPCCVERLADLLDPSRVAKGLPTPKAKTPNALSSLVIDEVSLVYQGANEGAVVILAKSDAAAAEHAAALLKTPAQKNDGPVEDAVLLHNGFHQTRWSEADGGRVYRHDLRALLAYRIMAQSDLDLWPVWARVRCPVLMLHGLQSDALTAETVARMQEVRDFSCVEIPDTGHTPALSCANQLALIGAWLDDPARFGSMLCCVPGGRAPRTIFPSGPPAS